MELDFKIQYVVLVCRLFILQLAVEVTDDLAQTVSRAFTVVLTDVDDNNATFYQCSKVGIKYLFILILIL